MNVQESGVGRQLQCAGRMRRTIVWKTSDRARERREAGVAGPGEPLLCLPVASHTFLSGVRSGQRPGHGASHGRPPRQRPENSRKTARGRTVDRKFTDPSAKTC